MQMAADVAMVAVVLAFGQIELWRALPPAEAGSGPTIVGPRLLVMASCAAATCFLIWRRRFPLGSLAAAGAVLAIPMIVYGSSESVALVGPVTLAAYSVGAHCERRKAALGLALIAALIVLHELRDPQITSLHSVLGASPGYLVVVVAWLAGVTMRTRRLYVAELRERADRAEAEREQRTRTAIADEQRRIARELHDAVAHAMSVIVIQAEAAEEMLAGDPERARLPVQRIQRVGRESLAEMRRLLGVLRSGESPSTAPQPGLSRLDALADEVRAAGLPVALTVEGVARPVPVGVDISAYRIVQEALTNALKHARASRVDVRVRYGPALELDIADDGIGAPARQNGGHGIVGMRERVALYGGTLEIGSPGRGFRVQATLPLPEPA